MNDFTRRVLRYLQYLPLKSRINRYQAALSEPREMQCARLLDILAANGESEFGRMYNFASLKGKETADIYRRTVPVHRYADFAPYIERMKNGENNVLVSQPLEMFAVTSGTEAAAKYIPVTRRFTVEHHYMHLMWLWQMISARPLGIIGPIFTLISPAVSESTVAGIPCGASSGKQYRDQSIPMRRLHPVPYSVFLIPDFLRKYYTALLFAVGSDIRTMNSVNPSSLTLIAGILDDCAEPLLDDLERGELAAFPGFTAEERQHFGRLLRPNPRRAQTLREIRRTNGRLLPRDVWPNLCAINTWQGGCAPFYLPRVREYWGDAGQRCWGLRATEGIFSVPHADNTASGTAAIGAHFLEFAEEKENEDSAGSFPDTRLVHELEIGKRYRLICTTSGGLYRYDMGDIVEVTGMEKRTPEIAFLHKAGGVLSVTGEKVTLGQAVQALDAVSREVVGLEGFTVSVEMTATPRYQIFVETSGAAPETPLCERIAAVFENELCAANIEYRDKRASGRLGTPTVTFLPSGSYRTYREYRVNHGSPDGQVKPPQLLKPEALAEALCIMRGEKTASDIKQEK